MERIPPKIIKLNKEMTKSIDFADDYAGYEADSIRFESLRQSTFTSAQPSP